MHWNSIINSHSCKFSLSLNSNLEETWRNFISEVTFFNIFVSWLYQLPVINKASSFRNQCSIYMFTKISLELPEFLESSWYLEGFSRFGLDGICHLVFVNLCHPWEAMLFSLVCYSEFSDWLSYLKLTFIGSFHLILCFLNLGKIFFSSPFIVWPKEK